MLPARYDDDGLGTVSNGLERRERELSGDRRETSQTTGPLRSVSIL